MGRVVEHAARRRWLVAAPLGAAAACALGALHTDGVVQLAFGMGTFLALTAAFVTWRLRPPSPSPGRIAPTSGGACLVRRPESAREK